MQLLPLFHFKIFPSSHKILPAYLQLIPIPTPSPREPSFHLCKFTLDISANGIIQYVISCAWIFSLSMFLKFIHAITCISSSFLFVTDGILLCDTTFCLSFHQLIDISSFGLMMMNTAMNILMQIFEWTCFHFSWVKVPRNGIAGMRDSLMCNFSRSYQAIFHNGCTILHSCQEHVRVSVLHIFINIGPVLLNIPILAGVNSTSL